MSRKDALMPNGVPRYIRCYDNNGESIDRYTVVFTGKYKHRTGGEFVYLAMNGRPFHPQGFGQHGGMHTHFDTNGWGWPPSIGRSNHLGKRIPFDQLPPDCQKLVLQDYTEIWGITV